MSKISHKDLIEIDYTSLEKQPERLRSVLKECHFTLTDLKQKNKEQEEQLNKKNMIIDKLMHEKQEHILHLSVCESNDLKKQYQQLGKRSEQMRQNFEKLLQNQERMIKKYQVDIDRLKGFNKVLRIQNNHLRDEVSQTHLNWRQREKKIGKITPIKNKHYADQGENKFQFTVNRSEDFYSPQNNIFAKMQTITPEKFKTSKSTNLSTAVKSNYQQHSKDILENQQKIPNYLFQNSLLKNRIESRRHNFNAGSYSQQFIPSKDETVEIWFSKLKQLLADSDDQL